jgi:dihydrodipicolinate synthase/N-acetylneuraminate lyase
MRHHNLRGIVTPLVTPLEVEGGLDIAGLERLVEHVVEGGINGLFLLGTTGEGPSLSYCQRRRVIRLVCSQVRRRVPILASITDTSFDESIAMASYAESCGADAVVMAPPYYFPPSPQELCSYLKRVAASVSLPFYLYNLPSLTKVHIDETVVQTCLEIPGFLGLKDSSGDMQYFKRMRRLTGSTGEHALFIGPEELLVDSLFAGGDGGVAGGSNVWPGLYSGIFRLAEEGDWIGARKLQSRVLDISRRLYSVGGYGASVVRQLKALLCLAGICQSAVAPPCTQLGEREMMEMKQELAELAIPL